MPFSRIVVDRGLLRRTGCEPCQVVGLALPLRLVTPLGSIVGPAGRHRHRKETIDTPAGPLRSNLPRLVLAPRAGPSHDHARLARRRKHVESRIHNVGLVVGVIRLTGGSSEGIVNEQRPWRTDACGDGQGAGEDHGGDAGGFEVAGDQTDRLMAHGSNGHQEDRIALLLGNLGQ